MSRPCEKCFRHHQQDPLECAYCPGRLQKGTEQAKRDCAAHQPSAPNRSGYGHSFSSISTRLIPFASSSDRCRRANPISPRSKTQFSFSRHDSKCDEEARRRPWVSGSSELADCSHVIIDTSELIRQRELRQLPKRSSSYGRAGTFLKFV